MTKLKTLLGNVVLVKLDAETNVTDSGLHLPEEKHYGTGPVDAEILMVGLGVKNPEIKSGDKVIVLKQLGTTTQWGRIYEYDDVIGVRPT